MFTETYDLLVEAIERERQIKGWTRAKKEALIALAYERLPELARNHQEIQYVPWWKRPVDDDGADGPTGPP
ncbi:hypothetical protein J2X50_002183 [Aminobacter sp. BE322]